MTHLSTMNNFFTYFYILTIGLCLARADSGEALPSPERSIDDSDFAKTANYIMKTAMKLPPHILPTLEELDTKDKRHGIDNQLGVYLPQKRNPLGIYIPRPIANGGQSQSSRTPILVTPRPKRHRHPNKNRQDKIRSSKPASLREKQQSNVRELPTFTVNPVLPKFRLGGKNPGKNPGKPKKTNQQQRSNLLGNLHSAASERNNRIRNRNPGQRVSNNQFLDPRAPYDYEPTNFEFPPDFGQETTQVKEEIVPRFDPFLNKHNSEQRFSNRHVDSSNNLRRARPSNQVEKYVPTFMKEVLAKSFLKDPDTYLARLKAKERAKQLANRNPQLPDEKSSPAKPVNLTPPLANNPFDNFNANPRPVQKPGPNPELNFDSNFPWNPNSYDDSGLKYKGGYVFNDKDLSYDLDHTQQYELDRLEQEEQSYKREYQDQGDRRKHQQHQHQQQQHEQQQQQDVYDENLTKQQKNRGDESPGFIDEGLQEHNAVDANEEQPPLTKTICFCCGNEDQQDNPNARNRKRRNIPRSGKTIKIANPRQSARVYKNQDFLRRSLNCVDQEPIEVVLVFNRKGAANTKAEQRRDSHVQLDSDNDEAVYEQEHEEQVEVVPKDSPVLEISERNWEEDRNKNRRRKKIKVNTQPFISEEVGFETDPESREQLAQYDEETGDLSTHEYYDPAKLTFIFSTPSPLVKKSSQIEDSVESASHSNNNPNHLYNDAPTEPMVTKVEQLLKFTTDFQKSVKSRRRQIMNERQPDEEDSIRQKVFDEIERRSDDIDYDNERDEIIQANANVPISKSSHRLAEKITSTTTQAPTTEESKLDSFEEEEKSFPMERRYDVSSHAVSGSPRVRFWTPPSRRQLKMSTQSSSSEEEGSDLGKDLPPELESSPHSENSFTDDDSEISILEKVLEHQGSSAEEESLHQDAIQSNPTLEVTSEAGPAVERTTEEDKTSEVQTTTNQSEKSTPSASDMTNGYLFFRMLTG